MEFWGGIWLLDLGQYTLEKTASTGFSHVLWIVHVGRKMTYSTIN